MGIKWDRGGHTSAGPVKFIYSEKATKFCKISPYEGTVKSTVEILQNYVAFSEHMNFNWETMPQPLKIWGQAHLILRLLLASIAWICFVLQKLYRHIHVKPRS